MLHHDSSYHMTTHDPEVEVSENGAHENKRRCKSGTIAFDDEIDDEEYSPDSAGLVFSSLDTHFSPLVALEQFIFHVFFPFTVPIAWCRYGMKHTHLQMYGWKQKLAWPSTYIPFVCIASSLVCLVAEPDVLKIEQLVLPFGVFILQRLMIAVKYASLSPDEYSAFMNIGGSGFSATLTPEDKEKSAQFLNNMQLGSGWIVIPDTLIKHELLVSSIIQGVDLCNLYFYIPLSSASPTREPNPEKMYRDWMRLRDEPESEFNLKKERSSSQNLNKPKKQSVSDDWEKTKDGKFLKVNCMDVCEYMFHVLNKRVKNHMGLNFYVIIFLDAVIAYNYWTSYSYIFHASLFSKVFFVSALYLLIFFFPVLFLFCIATATDVYRRYEISRMLKELINVSDVKMVDTRMYEKIHRKRRKQATKLHSCAFDEKSTLKSFGQVTLPRIDMSMPSNYIAWCMCRQVLSKFGNRFLFRTNLYLGVLALLVIIQVVITLYDMYFSSKDNADVCSSFSFYTAIQTCFLTTVFLCGLMTAIHMTNRQMKKHRVQLSTHLLHANKALHDLLYSESFGIEHQGHDGVMHTNKKGTSKRMYMIHPHSPKVSQEPGSREAALSQLQECIESANAVVQTVVEFDDVQPLSIMNLHVEKEYVFTIISSGFVYALLIYSYCDDRFNMS